MEYQDELSKIHWNTPLEEKEMYALTYKMFDIEHSNKKGASLHYELRARELADGILTALAHDDKIDVELSDVNTMYINACNEANDLRLLLSGDLQLANRHNDSFLQERLQSCFSDFMTADKEVSDKTFKVLKKSLQKALSKGFVYEKSDKDFEECFDKNSEKTLPYTLNFSTLDGFDACVRNFIVAQLKDKVREGVALSIDSFKGNSPSSMAKYLFSGKAMENIFLENLELHIKSGDIKAKTDAERIVEMSKIRDEALLHMAERRAAYLLGKTPFYLEQANFHRSNIVQWPEVTELCKELREKPYTREPAILQGRNPANSSESMYIRKARKYIYDNFIDKPNLCNKANRVLYRALHNFKDYHMNIAKDYLTWQANRIQPEELVKFCEFVRDHCFDRHHEFDRVRLPESPEEIKKRELEEHYRKQKEKMEKDFEEMRRRAHWALVEKRNKELNSSRKKDGFKKRKDAGKDDDLSR